MNGRPEDYQREWCVDLVQLVAFLRTIQPKLDEALDLANDSPARRGFLARLYGEMNVRHGDAHACRITHTCYHFDVNSKHRKTLELIWAEPVNGNLEWARIEALLKAIGCRVIEGAGSSVTFEYRDSKATLHRPHPGKEALRYRVRAMREFLQRIKIEP